MPFLRINGWQIPVLSKGAKDQEIGKRQLAFDGTPMDEIRATKRVWIFRTPPVTELVAEAIRGIVSGMGWVWPFASDLYSHKGIGPVIGLDQATIQSYLPGDAATAIGIPSLLYLSGAATSNYTPHRVSSFSVDPDSTNMLTADQRDAENAPTGYHQFGTATLSGDTGNYWQGTKSLKAISGVTLPAGAETDALDPGAGSANKTYTGSVYVKSWKSTPQNISVGMFDQTNTVGGAVATISAPPFLWVRVAASITIGGVDTSDLRLRVYLAASGETFYADGFQIEEKAYPTAWVDGARGGADDLAYDFSFNHSFVDWSAGIWFWGPAVARAQATHAVLWEVGQSSSTSYAKLYRPSGSLDLVRWETGVGASSTKLNTGGGDVDWEAWNFIGVSFRTDPETGELAKTMRLINASGSTTYIGGVTSGFVLDQATKLYVGNSGAADHWTGHLGEFMFFPFAVPVALWDAIGSTLGQAGDGSSDALPLPQWPRKLVTGDAAPFYPIGRTSRSPYGRLFEGRVTAMDAVQASDGSEWRNNLQQIEFELRQV